VRKVSKRIIEKAKKIKLIVMDVDGVLTPGDVTFINGREVKFWYARDRIAFYILKRTGLLKTAWLTGRVSEEVKKRGKELGIDALYFGVKKKKDVWENILKKFKVKKSEVAYIGDDIVDLYPAKNCGLSFAPSDSCCDIKKTVDFITESRGGRGVFREVVELILKAKGKWKEVIRYYL